METAVAVINQLNDLEVSMLDQNPMRKGLEFAFVALYGALYGLGVIMQIVGHDVIPDVQFIMDMALACGIGALVFKPKDKD